MQETTGAVSGAVITFFSTASAVGKTLLSCNMASELARQGARVALVDFDLQFGDICNYLHLEPQQTVADAERSVELMGDAFDVREFLTPYRYGGNTPESGFDCSGLVAYVFRDMLDLKLPRTSGELAKVQGPRIEPRRLAPADLVFFGSASDVSHVGIYVGEGRFVHAPSSGGTVRLDRLDGAYWRDHYSGAKRVLP